MIIIIIITFIVALIIIISLVHSGGNADIGNKLAELLMPELDEKVMMILVILLNWMFW